MLCVMRSKNPKDFNHKSLSMLCIMRSENLFQFDPSDFFGLVKYDSPTVF